jgi:large subunit ribosomal protein L30
MAQAIRVKLMRSTDGRKPAQRNAVRGLGLLYTNHERVLADTPAVRGMVARVPHLVAIVEEGLALPGAGRGAAGRVRQGD